MSGMGCSAAFWTGWPFLDWPHVAVELYHYLIAADGPNQREWKRSELESF